MVTKYEKANRGKLLVAVMALVMVFAGAAVVLSDSGIDAEDNEYQAMIGDKGYPTLKEAVEASVNGDTIVLQCNVEDGAGIALLAKDKKSITIDLNGYTYTVAKDPVGSPNTQNQGFHFEAGNTVIIKNGKVTSTVGSGVVMLIQNYSDLTLMDLNIDGKNLPSGKSYVVSNNNCNTTFSGKTSIQASKGDIAFDVCDFQNYKTPANVTFSSDFTGVINGDVEIAYENNPNKNDLNLIIELGANVNIKGDINNSTDKGTIDVNGKLTANSIDNKGTVNVAGALKANVTNSKDAEFNYTADSVIDGKVDDVVISGNWSTLTLQDGTVIDAKSSIDASASQQVVIDGDVVITAEGSISILGKLIVNDGATLTLEKGAKLVLKGLATAQIDGEIIVEAGAAGKPTFEFSGSEMTINGTVTLNGENAFVSTGKVVIAGTLDITEDASAELNDAVISAGGNLTVAGAVTGPVINGGTVNINSEIEDNELIVKMRDAGILNATNVIGTIFVTDEGMTYRTNGQDVVVSNVNGITLTNVAGVVVTEKLVITTQNNAKTATAEMYIGGIVVPAVDAEGEASTGSIISVEAGKAIIDGEMSIGKVTFDVDSELDVKGTLKATQAKGTDSVYYTITGVGTVNVSGLIVSADPVQVTKINAATYTALDGTVTYNYYTTLENALAAGATPVTIKGDLTVSKDVTVPAGTTVKMDEESTLTISDSATMTVKDGAKFNNKGVTVEGTLVVENFSKSGVVDSSITSDVDKVSGTEKVYTKTYTNIYNALSGASDGEIVKLRADVVTINKDVVVLAGVTLQIDSNKKIDVSGAKVTVDGKVVVKGAYEINDNGNKKGATVVNGIFLYDNGDYTEKIDGAYFSYEGTNAIAPLAFAAENIDTIDGDVTVYGKVDVSDVTFDYTNGGDVTLYVKGTLKANTITLKNVIFNSEDAVNVNATIAMTNGSIILKDAVGAVIEDTITYDADNNATYTVVLSGDIEKSTADGVDAGSITINGKVSSFAGAGEKVTVIVPSGAVLTITDACEINAIVIDGTVDAKVAGIEMATATVMGTLNTDANATVEVGKLYVGIPADDLVTGANAVVGDKVSITEVAYVAPGSAVGKSITDCKSTEYYVENKLYLTAYIASTGSTQIDAIGATVKDAKFEGWYKEDGDKIGNDRIGAVDKVYAKVNYLIFSVNLSTVPGVFVYIDGMEFTTALNGTEMFAAGEHTVTVYLKAGYEGTPTITVDGKEITNGTFIITSDSANKIAVSGVTAIDYSQGGSDDKGGMTLVEILLIILVVMVVILAIVVILRMMRS